MTKSAKSGGLWIASQGSEEEGVVKYEDDLLLLRVTATTDELGLETGDPERDGSMWHVLPDELITVGCEDVATGQLPNWAADCTGAAVELERKWEGSILLLYGRTVDEEERWQRMLHQARVGEDAPFVYHRKPT
jgi:hypothetical protein